MTLNAEPEKIEKQSSSVDTETLQTPTESPGLSLLTKLIFFGVVAGVIFTFLRNRRGSVQEKSLA